MEQKNSITTPIDSKRLEATITHLVRLADSDHREFWGIIENQLASINSWLETGVTDRQRMWQMKKDAYKLRRRRLSGVTHYGTEPEAK